MTGKNIFWIIVCLVFFVSLAYSIVYKVNSYVKNTETQKNCEVWKNNLDNKKEQIDQMDPSQVTTLIKMAAEYNKDLGAYTQDCVHK